MNCTNLAYLIMGFIIGFTVMAIISLEVMYQRFVKPEKKDA